MQKLTVVKIGGNVIDTPKALDKFLLDFSKIEGLKILIHGGGKIATAFGERLGINPNYIEGRRVTDAETLELVTMVYAGLVNKNIVAKLQAWGTNAIGLTGADGNIIPAVKRPAGEIDFGHVGDLSLDKINVDQLSKMLNTGLVPVFCALTHDDNGNLLNTNADTIASVVSAAMAGRFHVHLVYCFEQPGVLSDFETKAVVGKIDSGNYTKLKEEGVIIAGMIPKMDNAFDALNAGVTKVKIGDSANLVLLLEDENTGTTVTR